MTSAMSVYERLQRVAYLVNADGPTFLRVDNPPADSIASGPFLIVNVPAPGMERECAEALLRAANMAGGEQDLEAIRQRLLSIAIIALCAFSMGLAVAFAVCQATGR